MYYKRGKRKLLADYTTPDIYEYYKDNIENPVSAQVFSKAIKDFNRMRMYRLIYHNDIIRFPARIGSLMIKMKLRTPSISDDGVVSKNGMPVDWKKTLAFWKKTYPDKNPNEWKAIPNKKLFYYLNTHTDGKLAYFYWDKLTSNVKNQSAYRINISKLIKNELNFAIKTNKNLIYYE